MRLVGSAGRSYDSGRGDRHLRAVTVSAHALMPHIDLGSMLFGFALALPFYYSLDRLVIPRLATVWARER